jgi:hypothetical protein
MARAPRVLYQPLVLVEVRILVQWGLCPFSSNWQHGASWARMCRQYQYWCRLHMANWSRQSMMAMGMGMGIAMSCLSLLRPGPTFLQREAIPRCSQCRHLDLDWAEAICSEPRLHMRVM